ncbi:MAG: mucoidy inhibitor MuiA family protein [Geobacter sp.]
MQIIPILLLLALTTPALSLAATPQRSALTPRITAVTVYQDRAQTMRSATVNLKTGTQIVALEGLPVLLQDDSIRVEGNGTARVTVAGVEIKRRFLEQTAEKRAKELEDEIHGLERKVGGLDAKKAGLSAQKTFLESIRVAWSDRLSKELAIGRPSAAELQDAAGFVASGIAKIEEQSLDIENDKLQLKKRIDALRRELREASGSLRKEMKTAEVTLEVTREGSFTLNLSGVVSRASWTPAYDVRLMPDGGSAQLTYRAQVRQQTGEDWNNVALTLSTARPASGGAPPELKPWRIAFWRPPPPAAGPRYYESRAKSAFMEMDNKALTMAAPEEEPEEEEAAVQTAQLASEATSVSFVIPKPVDIASDGSLQSSVISISTLPVNADYLAVPKLSPTVYLSAELVNQASYPLLAGPIRIFTGNTFTGSATLKKVAVGETFTLPFGSDDQLTVKREELKQHKEAGLFGKNRMGYRYRLEATNFRKQPQTITIKDQLPLAGDSEITVSLTDVTLQPSEKKDDGTLSWKLPLAAGEKKEFSYEIVVEYPKDREITGL